MFKIKSIVNLNNKFKAQSKILCCFLLLLSSCGETDFKRLELLEGFRILAITTATSEVNPGDTVTDLQVFFSDPGSGGRLITGTTVSCTDPGIAFGAEVSCDHDLLSVAGTYNLDTSADDDTFGLFTGLASATASVTVPATILLGRSARDQSNGVGYIIIFTFDVAGQEYKTFKRILASTRPIKNLNPGSPTASSIQMNGGPLALPTKGDLFKVTSNTEEVYNYVTTEDVVENRSEIFQVAWYISEGELSLAKTFVSEQVKYTTETPQVPFTLLAIIRDERGGIEILQFNQ